MLRSELKLRGPGPEVLTGMEDAFSALVMIRRPTLAPPWSVESWVTPHPPSVPSEDYMSNVGPLVAPSRPETGTTSPELSVVMPCLNEADSIGSCIGKATRAMALREISAEIIIADNGSTDGSQLIAASLGARVVPVTKRGYGNALMVGIAEARGQYVIMGDADDSYDFGEIPSFLRELRAGADLVLGCRLASGGGRIMPGAMPFLHRCWGNPMFSAMARRWFGTPVHDVYCGLRGFRKDFYSRLDQRCTGMEFATEMIIKASLYRARITEVPITLHKDGRKAHAPHLKTFRDGWRTLRFFLMYSPRWLFFIPGVVLAALGLLGYAIALPGVHALGMTFDAHTLLFASLAVICGFQAMVFAVSSKTFAMAEGLMPEDPRLMRLFQTITLERGLIASAVGMVLGIALLLLAINQWRLASFGALDYSRTMRVVIPGITLTTLGFQGIFSSFFLSILGMRRR
jgi:glycosyltransferase involved in cell wall biosynthesis